MVYINPYVDSLQLNLYLYKDCNILVIELYSMDHDQYKDSLLFYIKLLKVHYMFYFHHLTKYFKIRNLY